MAEDTELRKDIEKNINNIVSIIDKVKKNEKIKKTLYLYALTCLLMHAGNNIIEFYGILSVLQNSFMHMTDKVNLN